jgi:hypothetical protein
VEAEFLAAAAAEQVHTGGPVEICAVLNRLPRGLLSGPDDRVIDAVDALMDELYRRRELTCPGHRWSSGPPPTSIREHLVRLHAPGQRPSRCRHRGMAVGRSHLILLPARPAGGSGDRTHRRPPVPIPAVTARRTAR